LGNWRGGGEETSLGGKFKVLALDGGKQKYVCPSYMATIISSRTHVLTIYLLLVSATFPEIEEHNNDKCFLHHVE